MSLFDHLPRRLKCQEVILANYSHNSSFRNPFGAFWISFDMFIMEQSVVVGIKPLAFNKYLMILIPERVVTRLIKTVY